MSSEIHEVNKKLDDYIKANDEYHQMQDKQRLADSAILKAIHIGLYGDPETGELGLKKEIAPVTDAWKALKWLFGGILALGAFAAALFAIKKLF